MRLTVQAPGDGVLELNFMWLPTWVGVNHAIKKEIEEKIGATFKGREIDETTLDELDEAIIDLLQKKFPEIQFTEYLRAIRHVHQISSEG